MLSNIITFSTNNFLSDIPTNYNKTQMGEEDGNKKYKIKIKKVINELIDMMEKRKIERKMGMR